MNRVDTLIAAANRVFGPSRSPALVDALSAESGLHRANVELALDRSLELAPCAEDLALLHARSRPAEHVLVVLAANVLVAPLRAIAWALACAPRVTVRASRRANVFVNALLDEVPELAIERVALGDDPAAEIERAAGPETTIHLYGGQPAIDALREKGLQGEFHGPGFGAIVAPSEAIAGAAAAIAEDIVLFDQRGCLSPRIAFVLGDRALAAEALHRALDRLGARVPRGRLDRAEASAIARMRDSGILAGRVLEGAHHMILELDTPTIGPVGRVLPLISVPSAEAALDWLAAQPELASIGGPFALPGLRSAQLGAMQSPPLDGPVDLRVL